MRATNSRSYQAKSVAKAVFITHAYDQLNRMTEIRRSGTTLPAKYSWDALRRWKHLRQQRPPPSAISRRTISPPVVHQLKSAVTFS